MWYEKVTVWCLWIQVGVDAASAAETTYKKILSKLPNGPDALMSAYEAIEKTVHDVDDYVGVCYLFVWFLQLFFMFVIFLCMVLIAILWMRLL